MHANPGKNVDASIAIALESGSSQERKRSILVIQISCGTLYTAPPNCLQYHTGKQDR